MLLLMEVYFRNMTNETILKQAIDKAVKNGLDKEYWLTHSVSQYIEDSLEGNHYFALIFAQDFAKAFWGDLQEEYEGENKIRYQVVAWKHHLQTMVLQENPLEYLVKFLTKPSEDTILEE